MNGVSKAYAMTGWWFGYGAGPWDLINEISVLDPISLSPKQALELMYDFVSRVEKINRKTRAVKIGLVNCGQYI